MVKVNGELFDANGKSLLDFLTEQNYDMTRIAVEINTNIIPKSKYSETILKDEDSIEVVSFVGGG